MSSGGAPVIHKAKALRLLPVMMLLGALPPTLALATADRDPTVDVDGAW